jgi:hypothetical protein
MATLRYATVQSVQPLCSSEMITVTSLDLSSQTCRIINLRACASQLTRFGLLEYYDALRKIDVVFLVSSNGKTLLQSDIIAIVSGDVMRAALLAASGVNLPRENSALGFFYVFRELATKRELQTAADFPTPDECLVASGSELEQLSYAHSAGFSGLPPMRNRKPPPHTGFFFVPDSLARMDLLFDQMLRSHTDILALISALHSQQQKHTSLQVPSLHDASNLVRSWNYCSASVLLFFAVMANIDCRQQLQIKSLLSTQAAWLLLHGLLKTLCNRELPDDNIAAMKLHDTATASEIYPVVLDSRRLRIVCRWNDARCGRLPALLQRAESSQLSLTSSAADSDSTTTGNGSTAPSLFFLPQQLCRMRLTELPQPLTLCANLSSACALVSTLCEPVHILSLSARSSSSSDDKSSSAVTTRAPKQSDYVICADSHLWLTLSRLWAERKVDVCVMWSDKTSPYLSFFNTAVKPCQPLFMPWLLVCVDKNVQVSEFCAEQRIDVLWSVSPSQIYVRSHLTDNVLVHCFRWSEIKCASPEDAKSHLIELRETLPREWRTIRYSPAFPLPPLATMSIPLPYVFDQSARPTSAGLLSDKIKTEAITRAALHDASSTTSALFVVKDAALLQPPVPDFTTATHSRTTPCTFGTCDTVCTNVCASALRFELSSKLSMAVACRGELPLVFCNMWLRYADDYFGAAAPVTAKQWVLECNVRLTQTLTAICQTDTATSATLPVTQYSSFDSQQTTTNISEWTFPREITDCLYAKTHLPELSTLEVHASVLLGRMDRTLGISYDSWSKIGRALHDADQNSVWLRAAFRWWSMVTDSTKFNERDHTGPGSFWSQLDRSARPVNRLSAMRILAKQPRAQNPPHIEDILRVIGHTLKPN